MPTLVLSKHGMMCHHFIMALSGQAGHTHLVFVRPRIFTILSMYFTVHFVMLPRSRPRARALPRTYPYEYVHMYIHTVFFQ